MANPASLLGVLFHHGSERLDPGRQTEPIKADRNGVPSFAHSPLSSRRRSDRCCANFLHGVAFLRGFDTPSLPAQGEQRRSSYFNIPRGNSILPIAFGIPLGHEGPPFVQAGIVFP